jgi:hypothetical protein
MHGDDSPQMSLFAELSPPPDAAPTPTRRLRMAVVCTWRQAVTVLLWLKQPALAMPLRQLDSDIDTAFDFPRRAVVKAVEVPPVVTRAPSSIFTMADAMKAAKVLHKHGRFGAVAAAEPAPYRVQRDGDRVRVVRLLPEETDEWKERERVRRAKQRPPKPVRKAKTRGKKLLDMIGENRDDD